MKKTRRKLAGVGTVQMLNGFCSVNSAKPVLRNEDRHNDDCNDSIDLHNVNLSHICGWKQLS